MKAKKGMLVVLLALSAALVLGSCDNANASYGEHVTHMIGLYVSYSTNKMAITMGEDGKCAYVYVSPLTSGEGTYTISSSGYTAHLTFGTTRVTATTTDDWATFTTTSENGIFSNKRFSKQ